MAYAPQTLRNLANAWEQAIGSAICSGIVGDSQHGYGYHRAANELPASDYSRQLAGDRYGIDWSAAAAIDMSHNQAEMRLITGRFYNSWKDANDLRLNHTREVIGTLDGGNVIYMDTQSGRQGSSDSSHLWHIHVGGLRSNLLTQHAMDAILSIVVGQSWADYAHQHPDDPYVNGRTPAPAPTPPPPPPPPPPSRPGVPGPAYMAWPGRYLRLEGRPTREYMNGEDVLHYQLRMDARGWDLGQSGADMAFGPTMDSITRQYQANHGLTADGIVGPATWQSVETTPVS